MGDPLPTSRAMQMTSSEEDGVISALHAMELRFTERLTRVETEAKQWRTTYGGLQAAITALATESRAGIAAATAEFRVALESISRESRESAQTLAKTQAAAVEALAKKNVEDDTIINGRIKILEDSYKTGTALTNGKKWVIGIAFIVFGAIFLILSFVTNGASD